MDLPKVVLCTGGLNCRYNVKGIAHIEVKVDENNLKGGWSNFRISEVYANMNAHFAAAARHFGGNAVININYSQLTLPNFDFIVTGIGTVVETTDANQN